MAKSNKHPAERNKSVYSINSNVATNIEFVNAGNTKAIIYWLDYAGERQWYGELPPGTSYIQPTHLTHPWLVTNEKGTSMLLFYPDAQPRRVEIMFAEKTKKRPAKARATKRRR